MVARWAEPTGSRTCTAEEVVAAQVAIAPEIPGPLPFMPTADGAQIPLPTR